MTWLKRFGSALWFGVGAVVAAYVAYSATARREEARKWQQRATAEKEQDVEHALDAAEASMTQAKFHAAEADRIAKKAEEKIDALAKRDETVTDIVDRWRVRDDTNT